MADNPTKIYNDFVRANLPIGMSYDLNTNRYDINNHSFFKFKNSNWYYKYISKYGYSAASAYYVNGFEPSLVLDFVEDYYRTDGTASTFSDAVTHSRTGNATMVDADGLLKWAPHNLVLNSATLVTQNVTTLAVQYTLAFTGTGTVTLSGTSTAGPLVGTGVDNLVSLNFTPTAGTLTLTVSGSVTLSRLYRSDLGGMVNNPDTGNSYVPTTTAAVYSPRRGNHVWNGSAWVNEGLLHESAGVTNLLTYSEDITDVSWSKITNTSIGLPVVSGGISLDKFESTGVDSFRNFWKSVASISVGGYLTFSCYIKAGTSPETAIRIDDAGTGASSNRVTVPINWSGGVPTLAAASTLNLTDLGAKIVPMGNSGLYRVSLTVQNNTAGALTLFASYYVTWDGPAAVEDTYVGGLQAERGSVPTSYIPTAGATATRAAETLTVPIANVPYPSGSPLAVSIQMDGLMTYADTNSSTQVAMYAWSKDSSNYLNATYPTNGAFDRVRFEQSNSGTLDFVQNASAPYTPDINVPFSIASRHGSTFINGAVDGTALTANTTPTALPDLSATDLKIGTTFTGNIGKFRMWGDTTGDIGDIGIAEASA